MKNLTITLEELGEGRYRGRVTALGLETEASSLETALAELATLIRDDEDEDDELNAIADARADEPTIPWDEALKNLDDK